MVNAAPVVECIKSVQLHGVKSCTVILTPSGNCLDRRIEEELAAMDQLIIVCGDGCRFEEGLANQLDAQEISLGEHLLSGGEVPAAVLLDAVYRMLPASPLQR